MTRGNVTDQIVTLAVLREIFFGIVDEVVCADGPDQVKIPRVCHRCDFSSKRLGNLHRECSNPAARAVDQYFLSGFDVPMLTEGLLRGEPCDLDGRGFLKRTLP